MPQVTVKFIQGKTIDQKRLLVKDVTEAVAKNLEVPPDAITIELFESSRENLARGACPSTPLEEWGAAA